MKILRERGRVSELWPEKEASKKAKVAMSAILNYTELPYVSLYEYTIVWVPWTGFD